MTAAWEHQSRSAEETNIAGRRLGNVLRGGEVLALYGELGAGKTTFVKGLGSGLGVAEAVTSPTFVLVHEYLGRVRLAHADLYRIDNPDAVLQLGWDDYLDDTTVLAIEWAEHAGPHLPADRLEIHLSAETPSTRHIAYHARGVRSEAVLQRLRQPGSAQR